MRLAARGRKKAPRPRDEGLLFIDAVSVPPRGVNAEKAVEARE
jgi:hypothetical protein